MVTNVRNEISAFGFLSSHSKNCGCAPDLDKWAVGGHNHNQLTNEIAQAEAIAKLGEMYGGSPSTVLSCKEFTFLLACLLACAE